MSEQLRIALVQQDLAWKDKTANLAALEAAMLAVGVPADVWILPELFNTAFCVDDSMLAEDAGGPTLAWMQQMAIQQQAAICGSMLFREGENVYNRFWWVQPDGQRFHYDKRHLFSLVGEDKLLHPGTVHLRIDYKGWSIQPFICYDLRFPAWCQNDANADLQVYVANWPQKRIHHWNLLLPARATENQCYVAGVNRTGEDGFGNAHNGCSAVYDFAGQRLAYLEGRNGIEIVELSKAALQAHRERYPFWKDR